MGRGGGGGREGGKGYTAGFGPAWSHTPLSTDLVLYYSQRDVPILLHVQYVGFCHPSAKGICYRISPVYFLSLECSNINSAGCWGFFGGGAVSVILSITKKLWPNILIKVMYFHLQCTNIFSKTGKKLNYIFGSKARQCRHINMAITIALLSTVLLLLP